MNNNDDNESYTQPALNTAHYILTEFLKPF